MYTLCMNICHLLYFGHALGKHVGVHAGNTPYPCMHVCSMHILHTILYVYTPRCVVHNLEGMSSACTSARVSCVSVCVSLGS